MSTLETNEATLGQTNEVEHPGDGWQEMADFFVSFGSTTLDGGERHLATRIHHSQAGDSAQWQGLVISQLVEWMLHRARQSLESAGWDTSSLSVPPELDGEVLDLDLSGLWVSELKTQADGSRLRAEVCLSLQEQPSDDIAGKHIPFTVEFYVIDTDTSQSELVACHPGYLIAGEMSCGIERDWPIPAVGRYQLQLVASLRPPWRGTTRLQGPIIIVEP